MSVTSNSTSTGTPSTTRKSIFYFSSPMMTGISVSIPWDLTIVLAVTVMVLFTGDVFKPIWYNKVLDIRSGSAAMSSKQYIDCP